MSKPDARVHRSHNRRQFLQMAAAANAGFVLAACGASAGPKTGASTPAAAAGSSPSLKRPKIFLQLPTDPGTVPDLAAFQYMKEKYGIEPQLIEMSGSDAAVTSVIANQVDFASSGLGAVIIAAGQGQNVVAVAPGMFDASYQLVVKSSIPDWKGLEGKTIGITANNDPSYYTTVLQLQKHGVDASKINWTPVRGTPARATALQSGKIDAGQLSATSAITVLKDPKFKPLDAFAKDFPNFLFGGYFTTKAFIRDHGDVVQALVTSLMQQYRAMHTKTTYMAAAKALDGTAFDEALFSDAWDQLTNMNTFDPNLNRWSADTAGDSTSKLLAQYNAVEKYVPFNQWATTQFVDAARKQLGVQNT